MPSKKDVHTVRNTNGSAWVNKVNRVVQSTHLKQETAIEQGRRIAQRNEAEHVIHGRDGKNREKNSYGSDPNPPKDQR